MSRGFPPEDNDSVDPHSPSPVLKEKRERRQSVVLFLLTLVSTFWVYGTQFMGQDTLAPFTDAAVAWESGKFAVGLMAILLAHEMGHYVVAKMHGFALSLPYFIPFPFGFGTFGAVIRLRSLPQHGRDYWRWAPRDRWQDSWWPFSCCFWDCGAEPVLNR